MLALDRALYEPEGKLLLGEIALPSFAIGGLNGGKLAPFDAQLLRQIVDVLGRWRSLPPQLSELRVLWEDHQLGYAGTAYRLQLETIELQRQSREIVRVLRSRAKPEALRT